MEIKRDSYLNALINRMHNGMIKVVTGVRRSGKSYLIFFAIICWRRGCRRRTSSVWRWISANIGAIATIRMRCWMTSRRV